MANPFENVPYDEEPAVLESEMKAALKALEINKSPEVDGILIELFQATETESVKILMKMPKKEENLENKTMAHRLEIFSIHSNFQERIFQGLQ